MPLKGTSDFFFCLSTFLLLCSEWYACVHGIGFAGMCARVWVRSHMHVPAISLMLSCGYLILFNLVKFY